MGMSTMRRWPRGPGVAAVLGAALLSACGGGGGGATADAGAGAGAASCSVADQKDWLRRDMQQRYYWSGVAPDPDPGASATVAAYFGARLFRGDSGVPADRWSYISDTASFEQFFAEGRTMGYGLFVNGIELSLPLRVRYTEARSPAAAAGLQRGDILLSVNGRAAADLVARADFSALTPSREGETVALEVEGTDGRRRSLTLAATTYELTPVPVVTTLPGADGRPVGYLLLKDFITQAEAPLRDGLARLRAEGARSLILDLRYNGGGRVSTANLLASLIAGSSRSGQVFTELRFNPRGSTPSTVYRLEASAPGFERVVVLTGPRTCSASELVINGIAPHTTVSTVGAATCGKPFGFNPVANCGSTYNHVNFEAFNASGSGRYYDGIPASCATTDRFTAALGSAGETLTARALGLLGGVPCAGPAASDPQTDKRAAQAARSIRSDRPEPGERPPGMWAD